MVLASQSGRAVSGRSYMASRRRKKSKMPLILLLAVIGGSMWYFMSDETAATEGDDQGNQQLANHNPVKDRIAVNTKPVKFTELKKASQ